MPPEYQEPQAPSRLQSPFIIPLSIILAGALIGGGIYLSSQNTNRNGILSQSSSKNIDEVNVNPVTANDHILGNPNASVVIVEFSDTECPFCKVFHQTLHRIIDEYGKNGQVAWVYRHFPIDSLHKKAHHEAVATECANELGGNAKFWEYLDAVFNRTGSNDTLDPSELPKIASDIGLDVNKFNACLASDKYDALITQESQDAVRAGAEGTPHSVLITPSGEKISIKGAQPYDVIKTLIDTALNNGSETPISN